ncbi:hypothetical protein YC2023_095511 [Brassica napus]
MEETANQRNESTSEGKTGQYCEVLDLMRGTRDAPKRWISKMSALPKSDAPLITPTTLPRLMDATGGLLRIQQITGKPAGIFNSTGCQGRGHETAIALVFTCVVIGF